MPAFTPEQFMQEQIPARGGGEPDKNCWISEVGGLTQFGAFVEVLAPGSRSSIKHWHSAEDEMVYVVKGEVTLVEASSETTLHPGDAATFRAGVPQGHYLENRSASPTECLVVGTRAPVDEITYPDFDRVCHRDRTQAQDVWTTTAGEPASNPYHDLQRSSDD